MQKKSNFAWKTDSGSAAVFLLTLKFNSKVIKEYLIRVSPKVAADERLIVNYLSEEKGEDEKAVCGIRILKRSIDARQRTIFVNLKVRAYINELP